MGCEKREGGNREKVCEIKYNLGKLERYVFIRASSKSTVCHIKYIWIMLGFSEDGKCFHFLHEQIDITCKLKFLDGKISFDQNT